MSGQPAAGRCTPSDYQSAAEAIVRSQAIGDADRLAFLRRLIARADEEGDSAAWCREAIGRAAGKFLGWEPPDPRDGDLLDESDQILRASLERLHAWIDYFEKRMNGDPVAEDLHLALLLQEAHEDWRAGR